MHKGYVADAGYDSDDEATQIDVIYEGGDLRTVNVGEALLQREFQTPGGDSVPSSPFELRKMQLRPKRPAAGACHKRAKLSTTILPKGIPMHLAASEVNSRRKHNRKTRAATAGSKAKRHHKL